MIYHLMININVGLVLIYHDFDYLKKLPFYADAWFLDGFTTNKNKSDGLMLC